MILFNLVFVAMLYHLEIIKLIQGEFKFLGLRTNFINFEFVEQINKAIILRH